MSLSGHVTEFPVRLKEVAYDHVYFGTAFTWFEVGRSELSRAAGMPYARLVERGLGSFVTWAVADYRRPVPPTGLARVEARLAAMTRLRFTFAYAIRGAGSHGPCVTGYSEHAMAETSGKLCRVPPDFVAAFVPTGEEVPRVEPAGPENVLWRHRLRVRYEETDGIGVVYYGNYFALMEAAWSSRLAGGPWDIALNLPRGRALGVIHAECRYLASARYDDLLVIEVGVRAIGPVRVALDYRIANEETRTTLALGRTIHALTIDGRPARIPPDLWEALGVARETS